MQLNPPSAEAARALLAKLGAPARLLRHVELVGEAAEALLAGLAKLNVPIRTDFVLVGVVLHDAGKILHPLELDQPGDAHEPAGQALLVENAVSPEVARVCLSHARWASLPNSLEELLIALADKLWKGVRKPDLEELIVDRVARQLSKDRWELFIELDSLFETIASAGSDRLSRS